MNIRASGAVVRTDTAGAAPVKRGNKRRHAGIIQTALNTAKFRQRKIRKRVLESDAVFFVVGEGRVKSAADRRGGKSADEFVAGKTHRQKRIQSRRKTAAVRRGVNSDLHNGRTAQTLHNAPKQRRRAPRSRKPARNMRMQGADSTAGDSGAVTAGGGGGGVRDGGGGMRGDAGTAAVN